jgi:hypothetical protein
MRIKATNEGGHSLRNELQNRKSRHKTTHLIFNKAAQNTRWIKDSLFKNVAGKTGYPYVED